MQEIQLFCLTPHHEGSAEALNQTDYIWANYAGMHRTLPCSGEEDGSLSLVQTVKLFGQHRQKSCLWFLKHKISKALKFKPGGNTEKTRGSGGIRPERHRFSSGITYCDVSVVSGKLYGTSLTLGSPHGKCEKHHLLPTAGFQSMTYRKSRARSMIWKWSPRKNSSSFPDSLNSCSACPVHCLWGHLL